MFLGPRRCSIASVSHVRTERPLDVSVWELSVEHLVYTEPQLRADVETASSTPCWVPATDFSQIFSFQELSHFRSEQGKIFQNQSMVLIPTNANEKVDKSHGGELRF